MRTDLLRRSALISLGLSIFWSLVVPLSAQSPPAPIAQSDTSAAQNPVATSPEAPASATDVDTDQIAEKIPPADEIRQRISSLESATIDEVTKAKATEVYQETLSALGVLEQQLAETAHFQSLIESYESDLNDIKKLQSELPSEVPAVDDDQSVEQLEAEVSHREQELKQLRDKLDDSNTKLKKRAEALATFPKQIANTQAKLDDISKQLDQAKEKETTDAVTGARLTYLQAERAALSATLETIKKTREYYAMSGDLAQIRRDYRAKKLAQDEKYLATLREIVNQSRLTEANQQASAAASAAAVKRPEAIAELANSNAALAKDQAEIVNKIAKLDQKLEATDELLEKVSNAKKLSEERIAAAGRTEASGQQLRQQQEQLPDTQGIAREIALRGSEQSDAIYSQYEMLEERNAAEDADLDERVSQVLENVPADQHDAAEQEVRTLLESQRTILDSTIDNYAKYVEKLNNLTAMQGELKRTTQEYQEFIAANVLWIRSCTIPSLSDLKPMAGALAWSLDPSSWRDVVATFWKHSGKSPTVVGLFALVLLVSLYYHRQMRVRLREIGEQSAKRTCTKIWPTFEAIWITLLLALPWPTLLGFIGWWIDSPLNESEFVRALSVALKFTAVCLLLLEFLRHLCRSGGLADAHFDWPHACLSQIRRMIRGLIWVGIPLTLWLTGLETQNVEKLWSSTLGRACFVAIMLFMTLCFYRMLLASSSPFKQVLVKRTNTRSGFFYNLWAPVVAALPLLLAILAVIGYYYTAQQISLRLLQSAAVILSLLVLGALTKRWILLNRRRLAREQARQKRAAALAAAEAAPDSAGEAPPPVDPLEDEVDLVALGEQTNNLIVSVLVLAGILLAWFIWQDLLPAISYAAASPVSTSLFGELFTWGNVIRFLIVVAASFVIVRNVPALLEFAVLQHLPMDSGARYAVTSICRYTLVAIAMVLAYLSLGFDGSSIQWLVAAMGVGLGFGLQEIFANFVSGIILLFERPIRVGDIVTLDDKTGTVSRIRMRATTLVDWERKEFIVPNKDFVTQRLLNWTLNDMTIRVNILVGVAYGSDTELACKLLKETAVEHPMVLKEPEPLAVFFGFGDSALNLQLFAFVSNLEQRWHAIHELHSAIDRKFKAAGLEISFPQRDLHIRSLPTDWHQQGSATTASGQTNGKAAESSSSKSREK
ncbi:mechanosensitive ion channel domain-containing protein [Bythopirellula goksoeyrii]|uniref:Miniconductance mechanosensitive channel MscM n=1 Tax=Bythopirellula goksoeyrii TaxID=1400387 RepID=A0A5B9Q2P7_9BACT|nr:mechanosensitive ion channel domain-containing protein [Bythopirellula goksoeyrii]QEG33297.1 Miniconductance mechanosensitive channel MscM precursor [Bythopirellula goksoeyrii]